jgi:glycosyltransferase involved in cell wall biosynthesis
MNILIWRAEYYGSELEGGVASYFGAIESAFTSLGCKVIYVTSGEYRNEYHKNVVQLKHSSLFKNLPEVSSIHFNFKYKKYILKLIEENKIDFIYLQHHDFQLLSLIKYKANIKFFIHVDGFQYWVKKNWGKLYFDFLHKNYELTGLKNADYLFVPSVQLKSVLFKETGLKNIEVVSNGVDPNFFKYDEKERDKVRKQLGIESKFVCGFVGTFGSWHGVDSIAESINFIRERIENSIVLLVGDGPLRPKIENIIDELNARENVILTGMIPFKEVPSYMSACDVLLTPCKNNEDNSAFFNSPLKLYEYMAMGKPIIATSVGQQAEVIIDKENGFAIPENDPIALADSVKFIYDNPELAEKCGMKARKEAIEKYSWKSHVEKIINIYNNLSNVKS